LVCVALLAPLFFRGIVLLFFLRVSSPLPFSTPVYSPGGSSPPFGGGNRTSPSPGSASTVLSVSICDRVERHSFRSVVSVGSPFCSFFPLCSVATIFMAKRWRSFFGDLPATVLSGLSTFFFLCLFSFDLPMIWRELSKVRQACLRAVNFTRFPNAFAFRCSQNFPAPSFLSFQIFRNYPFQRLSLIVRFLTTFPPPLRFFLHSLWTPTKRAS